MGTSGGSDNSSVEKVHPAHAHMIVMAKKEMEIAERHLQFVESILKEYYHLKPGDYVEDDGTISRTQPEEAQG